LGTVCPLVAPTEGEEILLTAPGFLDLPGLGTGRAIRLAVLLQRDTAE
jgi:hypothetical protein